MYKVINGKMLIDEDDGSDFVRGGLTERDFYDFEIASQSFFHSMEWENPNIKIMGKYAHGIWVRRNNCVTVVKRGRKYKVCNGFHRAYIAWKYGLDILVWEDEEEKKSTVDK